MERGTSPRLLTWLSLPVAAVLVLAALGLPHRPYSGLVRRGDWVAGVDPGSPAERAGLARGDRVLATSPGAARDEDADPLLGASPGVPLHLLRQRDGRLDPVTLTPTTLPATERRMQAALLAVASGFVVLGVWVWSERRDRLARVLFLACLAFAWTLAPYPRWGSTLAMRVYEALYTGVTLFVPALFLHLFAIFPESRRPSGARAAITRVGYAVAGTLFAAALVLTALPLAGLAAEGALLVLQAMAGLWFAAGLAAAIAMFALSYRAAGSSDARRRLRVALAGTVLGIGPLALLVAVRNLSPGSSLPGERWAVLSTLLVPASFAWATVVHRVFAFRVALRAAVVAAALALAVGLVYVAGEWLAAAWRPDLGDGLAGGALAFLALAAAVAIPGRAGLRALAVRFVPEPAPHTPAEWLARHPQGRRGGMNEILATACEAAAGSLRLDGCLALRLDPEPVAVARTGELSAPELPDEVVRALAERRGPLAIEDLPIAAVHRASLESAGVSWLLPVGDPTPRALLMLGRRLGGSWLGTVEARELRAFSGQLEVLLENAALRSSAREHGAIDRELTRAGSIQAHLLPREVPSFRTLDCAAAALSSEAVGGDYYDFVRGAGPALTIAVGDAAGKGVPAALMRVWAQAGFRSRARRGASPSEVLDGLNRELVELEQPDAFVALLCVRIEARSGRLAFANAGLTPPLVRRRDGTIEQLTHSGVLLGVTPLARFQDARARLAPGDVALLYTDGLSEAQRGDEMFGVERIAAVLHAHWREPAERIVHELLGAARAFADHPLDDLTAVVLRQRARVRRARPRIPLAEALKWGATGADSRR